MNWGVLVKILLQLIPYVGAWVLQREKKRVEGYVATAETAAELAEEKAMAAARVATELRELMEAIRAAIADGTITPEEMVAIGGEGKDVVVEVQKLLASK